MVRKLTSKNLSKFIDSYPTINEEGFIQSEIDTILVRYGIDKDKFNTALGVNTCMVIKGEVVTYHCDVEKGLRCVLENREQNFLEWD